MKTNNHAGSWAEGSFYDIKNSSYMSKATGSPESELEPHSLPAEPLIQ